MADNWYVILELEFDPPVEDEQKIIPWVIIPMFGMGGVNMPEMYGVGSIDELIELTIAGGIRPVITVNKTELTVPEREETEKPVEKPVEKPTIENKTEVRNENRFNNQNRNNNRDFRQNNNYNNNSINQNGQSPFSDFEDKNNDAEKLAFRKILEKRYRLVRNFVDTHKSDAIEAMPFNSGYFMSFKMNGINAEQLRKKLLSESDLEVYNIYILPYEPFKVNWDELYPIPPCEPDELISLVENTFERGKLGDLIEEEELLIKRYCMWNEEQSQKRIPFNRRSSADMITRAMRDEKLISIGAPEIVVTEEGRLLAEEMVLYYFGKEEPIIWD